MNTTAINDPLAECQVERVSGADNHTYMCGLPARWAWFATPEISISVCAGCKRWLETLEELGQKL